MTGSPPATPARPAPAPRRRWRRAAGWTLGGLVVLLAALHTAPVKRLVAATLTRLVGGALRAEVRLDRLDYRLWAGRVFLEGFELSRPRLEIACARAEVDLDLGVGLRLQVEGPRVIVTQGQGDQLPLRPSRPWTILERFGRVEVSDAALELRSREGTPWLRLAGVEARLEDRGSGPRGPARVAEAGVGWPQAGIRVEGVSAEAELVLERGSGAVRVLDGEVRSDHATLVGRGRLEQIRPILASAEGRAEMEARLFEKLVPVLELDGHVSAEVSFEKGVGGARGSLEVQLEDLRAHQVGPWAGSVLGTLEGRQLRIDSSSLAGYGGQAEATGVVYLGDGPSGIDARVSGLDMRALVQTFVDEPPPLASRVDGTLRLDLQDWKVQTLEGHGQLSLRPGDGEGWPVVGSARLGLGERLVSFVADDVKVRTAELAGNGSLSFDKQVDLHYALHLPDLGGVPALLGDVGVAVPALALGGAAEIVGEASGQLPEWRATAAISSEGLTVEEVDLGLEGTLAITPAGIEIESLAADGEDGSATVAGLVPLADSSRWSLDAEVEELRLTDALGLRGVPLTAVARGRARVEGPRADPTARFEVEARAEPLEREASRDSAGSAVDPIDGAAVPEDSPSREPATLEVAGSIDGDGWGVDALTASLGGGTVEGSGSWRWGDRSLEVRTRLAEVRLARLPWVPVPAAFDGLDATLSGEAALAGRREALEGQLRLVASKTRYQAEALRDLELEATVDRAVASLKGRVGGAPLLSGRLALEDRWPLHLDLELAALPLTRLLRSVPTLARVEATLALAGQASLDVSLDEGDDARYEVRVEALELDLGGGGSSAGPFVVAGDRQAATISGFDLRSGETRFRADGDLGLASDARSPLALHGDIPLADLALLLPDAELEGEAELNLRLGGRLARLDLAGEIGLEGRGRVGPAHLEEIELEAAAREGVLTLSRARVRAEGGELSAQGTFPLGPRARGLQTLELQVQDFDVGSLLAVRPEDPTLTAPLEMSARVRATRPELDAIEAEGEITSWPIAVGGETLTLEAPARWRFAAGRLTLDGLRLSGNHGHLGVNGEWTPGGATRLDVTGEAELAFLNPFLGGELLLSGPGRLDLAVRGEGEDLSFEGGARLESARAVLREPPIVVSDLTGALEASGRSFALEANGSVGDGDLRVSGTIGLARSGPEIDVTLEADRLPLTFPEGLRSRSSSRVRLSGRERRYRLEGDVTVHRALYERETDFANQSLDRLGAELRALEERGSFLEQVQLDLRVRLEDGLRVQNRQLRVVADGGVRVGGDLLTPAVEGSVSIRDGGTVRLSRATMRLSDGRVDLAGYPARPPEVDISGRTQVTGIQIDLDLTGPLDDLRTSLSSPNRSDLTQADLATLLLTGRTAQAAADESGAIVAEEVAAALGSALNEKLGGAVLIDVSRDESLIVQDTDPTQRFNIGIPLGERLYLVYSQALDRSGVRWILDFRPTGQYRVRLISDSDDTGAVEVSHALEFDLWSRGRRERRRELDRPRVREIRFEGVVEADAARLRGKAGLKPGHAYDFFEIDASAGEVRKHLVEQGYRAALVEASETPVDEDTVDVVFEVDRGPRIEVDWVGDDPGRKRRQRLGETWDAYLSLEETATRRARALRTELRAERHYQAAVSAEVSVTPDVARVTFEVHKGPRGEGVDLVFEGNAAVADESLAAVLPSRDEAAFFDLLEPGGLTRLAAVLRTAGARSGFLSLAVGRPREEFDPESGRLRVTIPVEEGERASVVDLGLPEEALNLEGASPPDLSLRVGEPFRIDAYVEDRGTLAHWFRSHGYPEARVAGILDPLPGGIAVRFEVDTGPRPTVGAVRHAQSGRTRSSVVEGAVTLGPGDLIRPEDLALSRDHLSETRVFRSVDIRAEATDDPSVRDLVVDLVERPDLKVEYKVRYETGSSRETAEEPQPEESRGFQFGAGVEAANPFGWAHRYSVYALVGRRRQLLGSTFEAQTFFGRRWRTQVFLFDDSDRDYETTGITKRIQNVAFQQTKRWRSGLTGRRWHDRLRMQWGYSFRRIDYLDPEGGGEAGGYRAGLSNSLIGDTRDSVTDPHRGLFWTVNIEPMLGILGSDKDFVKLYGQAFAYVPLGSKLVWAHALRIGAAPGQDPLLLLDRRFKAGGATTVRGFAENVLGPRYRDVAIGGQGLLVFNQELRFPLPFWDRLYGGVFFDAGNVWALAGDLDLADLRADVGAGVRVMFPFGPLRLDWARVLDPREGEQRSRWVFALGHAF